jgi:hypothetical protein
LPEARIFGEHLGPCGQSSKERRHGSKERRGGREGATDLSDEDLGPRGDGDAEQLGQLGRGLSHSVGVEAAVGEQPLAHLPQRGWEPKQVSVQCEVCRSPAGNRPMCGCGRRQGCGWGWESFWEVGLHGCAPSGPRRCMRTPASWSVCSNPCYLQGASTAPMRAAASSWHALLILPMHSHPTTHLRLVLSQEVGAPSHMHYTCSTNLRP